jgi:response regulator RpfG family c-di-GMP phosphodiesterase
VVPLKASGNVLGFVYLECPQDLNSDDYELIGILASLCAAGLSNLRLHYDLLKSYDYTVEALATVSEYKDEHIGGHLYRIQELTRRLAAALGREEPEAESLARASRLHDIGKVGIPDMILSKPSKLSPEEFAIVSRHTTYGNKILEKVPGLELAKAVALSHHEKWDGAGYPHGLAGEDIPIAARIVAVVDVFDALASPRPYKGPWQMADIIEELEAGSGKMFDPTVIEAFLRILRAGDLDDLLREYRQLRFEHEVVR